MLLLSKLLLLVLLVLYCRRCCSGAPFSLIGVAMATNQSVTRELLEVGTQIPAEKMGTQASNIGIAAAKAVMEPETAGFLKERVVR